MRQKKLISVFVLLMLVLSACGQTNRENSQESSQEAHWSKDIVSGEGVTPDLFTGKTLTMVNVWGTFCPPCIEEMPYLGELAKDNADKDFQLIGVVGDVSSDNDSKKIKKAKEIIEKSQVDFTHIQGTKDVYSDLPRVEGFPTTFFFDKEGKVIGEPILGAASKEDYQSYIDFYLQQTGDGNVN